MFRFAFAPKSFEVTPGLCPAIQHYPEKARITRRLFEVVCCSDPVTRALPQEPARMARKIR
jgi:hypothetical protein